MKKLFNLYDSRLGWVALLGWILLLPSQVLAEKNVFKVLDDVEIHGFASSSYSYNFNNPQSRTNTLRIFDVDDNSFKFDVGELVFLKETPDTGDIGFRFDLTFGFSVPEIEQQGRSSATAPFPLAPDDDDFDVQQGYVSWKAPIGNGLQLDFGKFITHIGAEVIEGYDGWNSNFSRSYLFGLAIPFVHTGIRASYDINDQISVMAALVNGFASGETDNNDSKALGLQLGYAPTDNIGILVNWIGGNETDNEKLLQIYDLVVDIGVTNELSLQFNLDYGLEENTSLKNDGSSSNWWGYAVIARYDVNKWFSMNVRGEYLNDSDGWATGMISTNLWEFTLTPEFRIHDNFVLRVEYRHDEASTPVFEDESGNFTNDTQDTVAFNALVYF
ncbi:MAG: porin [Nitrospinae bacterium]|nr:porin [Nitrospinota bacterium]